MKLIRALLNLREQLEECKHIAESFYPDSYDPAFMANLEDMQAKARLLFLIAEKDYSE